MNEPKKKGWFARNWKWFIPMGCLTAVAVMVGFVVMIMFVVFGAIKSAEPYKVGVEKARANAAVTQALGTPIEEGMFVAGNINVSGPSGQANLSIPLSGPDGKGTLTVVAEKSGGQWTFSTLVLEPEGGQSVNLLE